MGNELLPAAPAITKITGVLVDDTALRQLLELARKEVKFLEPREDISGQVKLQAATASLKQQLIELGKIVATVLIQTAIQIALMELRTLINERAS